MYNVELVFVFLSIEVVIAANFVPQDQKDLYAITACHLKPLAVTNPETYCRYQGMGTVRMGVYTIYIIYRYSPHPTVPISWLSHGLQQARSVSRQHAACDQRSDRRLQLRVQSAQDSGW